MEEALTEAIGEIGGPAETARALNISVQAVSKWSRCPIERVLPLEKLSGVSRYRLRPDIYGEAPERDRA